MAIKRLCFWCKKNEAKEDSSFCSDECRTAHYKAAFGDVND